MLKRTVFYVAVLLLVIQLTLKAPTLVIKTAFAAGDQPYVRPGDASPGWSPFTAISGSFNAIGNNVETGTASVFSAISGFFQSLFKPASNNIVMPTPIPLAANADQPAPENSNATTTSAEPPPLPSNSNTQKNTSTTVIKNPQPIINNYLTASGSVGGVTNAQLQAGLLGLRQSLEGEINAIPKAGGFYSVAAGNSSTVVNNSVSDSFSTTTTRGAFSAGSGISYNSTTGVISATGTGGVDLNALSVIAVGYNNATSTLGTNSSVFGYGNTASGAKSSAFGYINTASGGYSVAVGVENDATGQQSIAMGLENDASNYYSLAFGYQNDASGNRGSAFGWGNSASGTYSSASGYDNSASGNYSSSFGLSNGAYGIGGSAFGSTNVSCCSYSSASGYRNSALSDFSSAFGFQNTASSTYASVFGAYSIAGGLKSLSLGYKDNASGDFSSAIGACTTASACYASAFGSNITNNIACSTMIGPSNTAKLTILSSGNVGIGTTSPETPLDVMSGDTSGYDLARFELTTTDIADVSIANATANGQMDLTIGSDGVANIYSGKATLAPLNLSASQFAFCGGNVGIGTTSPSSLLSVAGNAYIAGNLTLLNPSTHSVNSGAFNTASAYSSVFGLCNTTCSAYNFSVALGACNTASGGYGFRLTPDIALGYKNQSTSSGFYNGGSTAVGFCNTASGYNSSAFGCCNNASCFRSDAFGSANNACNLESSASGYHNTASGCLSSAFGYANTASASRASAFGFENTASGCYSSALGYSNTAIGCYTSAFGYGNYACANTSSVFGTNITDNVACSTMIGPSNTAKLTILSNGDMGIGTTTPSKTLTVAGDLYLTGGLFDSTASSGTNGMVLQTTGAGTKWVATSTLGFLGSTAIGSGTAGQLPYYASSGNNLTATSSLFLATSGNVGIGTTSPSQLLSVAGNAYVAGDLTVLNPSNHSINVGAFNTVSGNGSYVFGSGNTIGSFTADSTAVGYGNTSCGLESVIFGFCNTGCAENGAVALGVQNNIENGFSTESHFNAIGSCNTVSGYYSGFASAIGSCNTISNYSSGASAFGYHNTASAYNSSAFGNCNNASGRFSSAFGSLLTNSTSCSTMLGYNTAYLRVNSDGSITFSNGACINSSGVGSFPSDKNLKENFTAVDSTNILDKINSLPITSWNYKANPGVNYVGPVAQDFYAAFGGLGGASTTIPDFEPGNIALVGVQALSQEFASSTASTTASVANLQEELNPVFTRLYGTSTALVTDDASLLETFNNYISGAEQWLFSEVSAATGYFKNIFADTVTSNKVQTKTLCLDDICLTKAQLQALIQQSESASSTSETTGTTNTNSMIVVTGGNSDDSGSANTGTSTSDTTSTSTPDTTGTSTPEVTPPTVSPDNTSSSTPPTSDPVVVTPPPTTPAPADTTSSSTDSQ